jgi:hypothetical protein
MLGVSALLAARTERMVNGAADQLVSEIRQTRSFALETHTVTFDNNGTPKTITPKIWALKISPSTTGTALERYYYSDDTDRPDHWYSIPISQDFPIGSTLISNPVAAGDAVILMYNAPFAKYYQGSTTAGTVPPFGKTGDIGIFDSIKPTGLTDSTNDYSVRFEQGSADSVVIIDKDSGQVKK